jgi:chromosome segregation ATPase
MTRAVALGLCVLAWSGPVFAQRPKGDDGVVQTLRKAQGMLRQLSQEKAELEAKNAALEKQLAEQSAAIKALEAEAAKVEPMQGELKQLTAARQSLEQRLEGQTSRLHALSEQQKKALAELQRYRRDNQLLVDAVKERTRWIESCSAKNRDLVRTNEEILQKFGSRGFWDRLVEAEPFTGIAAVAKENAMQEFRFKIEDLEVTPWKETSPVAGAAPASGVPDASPAREEDEEDEDEE